MHKYKYQTASRNTFVNINTREYWDKRFGSGDWEENDGARQTRQFTLGQFPLLKIPDAYSGTILDFGCGQGDSIPLLRERYPSARLLGVDISEKGIERARKRYGDMAEFIAGDYTDVPEVDIILASNVFEHVSDDKMVARALLEKCRELYIFVPYREELPPDRESEHVNSYDEEYYSEIGPYEYRIFPCRGWSQYGLSLWLGVHAGNFLRRLAGQELKTRRVQICFHFAR